MATRQMSKVLSTCELPFCNDVLKIILTYLRNVSAWLPILPSTVAGLTQALDLCRQRMKRDVQLSIALIKKRKNTWRNFAVGDILDVQDTVGKWYVSIVKQVTDTHVLIHYEGWDARWDEHFLKTCVRLAARNTYVADGRRWTNYHYIDSLMFFTSIVVLPCGHIAVCRYQAVQVLDLLSGATISDFNANGSVTSLVVIADGRVATGTDTIIDVWDVFSGKCLDTLRGHTAPVDELVMLPSGHLASGSADSTIRIWDLSTTTTQTRDLSTTTTQALKILKGHTGIITQLAVLPHGQLASGATDHTIKVWVISTGRCIYSLQEHVRAITALCTLPNGDLASASHDQTIRVWNMSTGQCIRKRNTKEGYITALAMLPNGRLVSGSSAGRICVWDVNNLEFQHRLRCGEHVFALVVLPSGRLGIGTKDFYVRVLDFSDSQAAAKGQRESQLVMALMALNDRSQV